MDEKSHSSAARDKDGFAPRWPDWLLLALLMLLSAGIHGWLVGHTLVAARDSISFIRYALLLEQQPWREALAHSEQHPIYPLIVLAVSVPVRWLAGGTTCDAMVLSCQLASSLAAVLLVVPMFYLGRELFDRRVGFWAAALFQCLPVSAHVTADALSEAVFLLTVTTLLLLAAGALRRPSVVGFGLCGLCGGLAYLTRPEGALTVVAVGGVLLALQAVPAWRRPWRQTMKSLASLGLPALALALPYMIVIDGITRKTTPIRLLQETSSHAEQQPTRTERDGGRSSLLDRSPAVAVSLPSPVGLRRVSRPSGGTSIGGGRRRGGDCGRCSRK